MDADLRQHYQHVEDSFVAIVPSFLNDYACSAEIIDVAKLRDETSSLRDRGPHGASYDLQVELKSSRFSKFVEFSYGDGSHMSGERYRSCRLMVGCLDGDNNRLPGVKNWFQIQDYFQHKNVNRGLEQFFFEAENRIALPSVLSFINECEFLLNCEDVQRILTSKDWISVPHIYTRV